MLLDKQRFPILMALEAEAATIRAEALALGYDDFQPWTDEGAYIGDWRLFPLFMTSYPTSFVADFAANQRRCPRTMEILGRLPRVFAAGFSWMQPGCHITPHVDQKPDTQLRAHLGLRVPDGARFRVADKVHTWSEGEALVFEGLIDHESINQSNEPRIVMLFDFVLSPDELAYSREVLANTPARFKVSGGGRSM